MQQSDAPIAELLDRAVGEIDARGWCQGTVQNKAGQVCARGAMNIAVFGEATIDMNAAPYRSKEGCAALGLLYHACDFVVQQLYSSGVRDPSFNARAVALGSIPAFNDDPMTTVEDVRLVLKRASASAREQGL